jgi:hypothetical protein
MSQCLPNMPCYKGGDVIVYTTYPKGCTTSQPSPTTLPISSDNLYYAGPNLPYTGIQTEDDITTALQRIDIMLDPEEIFAAFIAAIDNNPTLKATLCAKIATCP